MTENKFSLIDIGKISKPITKLIGVVSQGIGILYEPTKIRRKAKAQADASLIRVEADIKKQELLKRAIKRFAFQEMSRQENIESIIKIAAASLPETVSEEPVDKDWVSRFFDDCKDVSNEELHTLWGRLLAGEVTSPGSCSRKTLAILKDLSQKDAAIFNKFCSFVWKRKDDYFLPLLSNRKSNPMNIYSQFRKLGITYSECLHLESIGLINCKQNYLITFDDHDILTFHGMNHICYIKRSKPLNKPKICCYPLTLPGIELFSITNIQPYDKYYLYWVGLYSNVYSIRLACQIEN
jgi:uncharacterized repeat protein (TIGR03899 family)